MSRGQDHKVEADNLFRNFKRQTRRKSNAEEKIRAILEQRQKIKEKTLKLRKQLHQQELVA